MCSNVFKNQKVSHYFVTYQVGFHTLELKLFLVFCLDTGYLFPLTLSKHFTTAIYAFYYLVDSYRRIRCPMTACSRRLIFSWHSSGRYWGTRPCSVSKSNMNAERGWSVIPVASWQPKQPPI